MSNGELDKSYWPYLVGYMSFLNNGRYEKDHVFSKEVSPHPGSLYELWVKYEFGIDNWKPAKEFTPSEHGGKNIFKFCQHKNFWDLFRLHVNVGSTSDAIIAIIYQCYGANVPVTSICELIRQDKARHGHPNLHI